MIDQSNINGEAISRLTTDVCELKALVTKLSSEITHHMEDTKKDQTYMKEKLLRHSIEFHGDGTDINPGQKIKVDRLIKSEQLRVDSDKKTNSILAGIIISVATLLIGGLFSIVKFFLKNSP